MLNVNLKEQVRQALAGTWEEFATSHPRLAEAIDRDVLVEQATASLLEDPAYRAAMDEAATLAAPMGLLSFLVKQGVELYLRRLI